MREGDAARGVPVTPKIGSVKFSELADDVVNDYRINRRRTLKDLEMRLRHHVLPFFGHVRATNITSSDALRFVSKRQLAGATNGEINRELAVVRRAFNLAVRYGRLLSKPHVPTLKERNVRSGFLEPEQFRAVRRNMPEVLQPLVSFLYVTGWRCGEAFNLQWSQVDFSAERVYLRPQETKNEQPRQFPFTEELRELLEAQRAVTDALQDQICPWVFHRKGKRIKSIRRAWETACKHAGAPGRLVHDLRRSGVRNLVRSGVPERVAMQMTGHKTRSVFDRYHIVSEADLVDARAKIDSSSNPLNLNRIGNPPRE